MLPSGVRTCLLGRCAAAIANLSVPTPPERTGHSSADENCLRLSKLAERLDCGESTIREWVRTGYLRQQDHYIGSGKKRRYLLNAIKARLCEPSPEVPETQVVPFVRKGRGGM